MKDERMKVKVKPLHNNIIIFDLSLIIAWTCDPLISVSLINRVISATNISKPIPNAVC